MSVKDYLIEDIKHLSDHDVNKLYKYVRRYLVANIDGLVDPLETTSNSDYAKSCECGSKATIMICEKCNKSTEIFDYPDFA